MTRPLDVEALKQLALLGALDGPVEVASSDLAELLHLSQQTASRRLIELAEQGFVHREMGLRRQRITIEPAGRDVLLQEHALYQRLFAEEDSLQVAGIVKTGLGEGRYYLSRPGYQDRFEDTLGWVPYPGTLNLDLGPEAGKIGVLKRHPVHTIEPFQAEGRTFGGVSFYPAEVEGTTCAAVLPHRSHYTDTLELIAPVCLRDTLPCEDGDRLLVAVRLQ